MDSVQAAEDLPDHRTAVLVVREADHSEHAAVAELVVAAYRAGGHLERDAGYGVHLADVAGRADQHPVLVAERDGRLVGTVTICPYGAPQTKEAWEGEVEFRYLGVAPEAWGTGVAEALVAACDDWARGSGAVALVLSAIDWNDAATRLYTRLGFERQPARDREPAPGIVLQVWRRALTPGSALTGPGAR